MNLKELTKTCMMISLRKPLDSIAYINYFSALRVKTTIVKLSGVRVYGGSIITCAQTQASLGQKNILRMAR